jgi:NTP pyrophosphatase (non-canonical NTP hydrolase)|tara:strand:+ start:1483 stop:1842 length:360 start_codon:yes stop_codon:yes gene_type:complete
MTQEGHYDYMLRRTAEENKKIQHPLNTLQQLMIITAEECGELTQVCSKTVRKFNTIEEANSKVLNATANRTKLIEEAGDVLCMLQLMQEHKLFAWEEIEARAVVKKNKLKKWSNLINET